MCLQSKPIVSGWLVSYLFQCAVFKQLEAWEIRQPIAGLISGIQNRLFDLIESF